MRVQARWMVTGLLLGLLTAPAAAQEEPPPPTPPPPEEPAAEKEQERPGRVLVEVAYWISQPTGLQYFPAIQFNPNSPLDTRVLDVLHGTDQRPRYRAVYAFDNDIGELEMTYYSQQQFSGLLGSDPGHFVFGESQAFAFHAGLFDNGFADAFRSQTRTMIRDFRLDFSRRAFDTSRVRGQWFVGVRRMSHQREQSIAYVPLLPSPEDFPPILPSLGNRPDLAALSDTVSDLSLYSGRGFEAGMDVQFPFGKTDTFAFEAGFALSVLRGTIHSQFSATTHAYYFVDEQNVVHFLAPPYDEFLMPDLDRNPDGSVPMLDNTFQANFAIGLVTDSATSSAQAADVHFGFRWKVWKGVQVLAGFRNIRYSDVGATIRPENPSVSANGVFNFESVSKTDRSVNYEGYYLGLAYSY